MRVTMRIVARQGCGRANGRISDAIFCAIVSDELSTSACENGPAGITALPPGQDRRADYRHHEGCTGTLATQALLLWRPGRATAGATLPGVGGGTVGAGHPRHWLGVRRAGHPGGRHD